jgi:glycosyltransferase involved in cell wall biosynthesis
VFTSAGEDLTASPDGKLPALELPETYILYHGPHTSGALRRLLDAWSWAAGSIGEYYPLLLIGLDEAGQRRLFALADELRLSQTIRALPGLPVEAIARLYQGCSALFHPAPVSPWGSAIRAALVCAKPVVALETTLANAVVGPAAYLVQAGEPERAASRALGAALITVIVEEEVSENLSTAARQRAAAWQSSNFGRDLLAAYQSLLTLL